MSSNKYTNLLLQIVVCFLLFGCTPEPNDIFENLLTGDRVKIDRTGTCNSAELHEEWKALYRSRFSEEYSREYLAFEHRHRPKLDSLTYLVNNGPFTPGLYDEYSRELSFYGHGLDSLKDLHDTLTDSLSRLNSDLLQDQLSGMQNSTYDANTDPNSKCAFDFIYSATNQRKIDDTRVITFSELKNDWKKVN